MCWRFLHLWKRQVQGCLFVGMNNAQAGINLGKLACSLLGWKITVVSSDFRIHESPLKASRYLQIPSTSVADFLQEDDLRRGDLYLKVKVAGCDL